MVSLDQFLCFVADLGTCRALRGGLVATDSEISRAGFLR